MRILARFIAVLVSACVLIAARGGTTPYAEVKAADLVAHPQLYWAQGVVFRDKLMAQPGGDTRSLGGRKVVGLALETAGSCYADTVLLPTLRAIKPGTSCLFVGTVYQESGWFSSKFHIVIQQVTASMESLPDMAPRLQGLQQATSNQIYASTASRLDALLSDVHAQLLAYSAASNVSLDALMQPDSPHREVVQQSVRAAITRLETDLRAPSSVFFSDLVTAMIAQRYVVPAKAISTNPPVAVQTNQPAVVPPPLHAVEAAASSTNRPVQKAAPAPEPVSKKPQPGEAVKPARREPAERAIEKPAEKRVEKHQKQKPTEAVKTVAVTNTPAPAVTNKPASARSEAKDAKKSESSSGSFFARLFGGGSSTNRASPATNQVNAVAKPGTNASPAKVAAPSNAIPAKAQEKKPEPVKKVETAKPAAPAANKTGGSFWSHLFGGSSTQAVIRAANTNAAPKAAATVTNAPAPVARPATTGTADQAVPLH